MNGVIHDFRYAVRGLARVPGFTIAVVLTLALGIGANTAIFSLINSLLLRSLPVKNPEQLVVLRHEDATAVQAFSTPTWGRLYEERHLFNGMFAYAFSRFNLAQGGEADLVDGMWAGGDLFSALGITPVIGRAFVAEDDRAGGGPEGAIAVISYRFWQRRFAGSPDVIGRTITIERVPFTIVGVTPAGFFGPTVGRAFDVALPVGTDSLVRGAASNVARRDASWLTVMARLKSDTSAPATTAALRNVQPQVREASAPAVPGAMEWFLKSPFVLRPAAAGISSLRNQYRQPLFIMMGTAAMVLLIACANIANLLLARATARRREMSVRLAIGASPWRLGRAWLIESLVLAVVGASLGVVLAQWAGRLLLQALSTPNTTVFLDLSPDWRMLGFTSSVAAVTAILFGAVPALRTSSLAPVDALKAHGRGADEGRGMFASGLVVVQVALSLVLVVGAALFLQTFRSLASVHLGFEPGNILLVNVNLTPARIDPSARLAVFERLRHEMRLVPGVAAVSFSPITPVGGNSLVNIVEVIGAKAPPVNQRRTALNFISPEWFSTYSMSLVAGRDFTEADRLGAPGVVIVNQAFARRFFNGVNPVGQFLRQIYPGNAGTGPQSEIVGMVSDATYGSLRERPPPTMYQAMAQFGTDQMLLSAVVFSLRSTGAPPSSLGPQLASVVRSVDPTITLTSRRLTEQVAGSLTQERLLAMLSGFFGVLALLLGSIGLYGLTSYGVNRRRGEIGIRVALGAAPNLVMMIVLRRVAVLVLGGVVVGTLVSWWMARFVATALLYGVQPRDPVTMISAAVVLVVVGLIAGWLPARRAASIDPAQVLREA